MLVLLLFFCSGATALVYEVLWSKYLSLMLGSTVQAQTVVLAVFMGGLAIGNRLFGKRAATLENPLTVYGVIELLIGSYAFLFSRLYNLGDWLFVQVGSSITNHSALLLLLKLFISLALLLFPTVLMGGTLPVIATWIQRQAGLDSGARVGIFYAINSLGAVLGAGMAGFVLVQAVGLVSSLELTALANLFIGLAAVVLGKKESVEVANPGPTQEAQQPQAAIATPAGESFRWFGLLVATTGGISMGLEVLSARALALIVGGSLQAFSLVLMSFILGIGLGSVVISTSRAARKYGQSTIYLLLLSAAAIVILNVIFIEHWTIVYSKARFGLASNASGYRWHQISVGAMSFIVLGLPAAFLGAVVPLSIRLLNVEGISLGGQVGRLLTCNTIGAVVGVLLTGFVLMPFIGLRGGLTTFALALIAITGLIAFQRRHSAVVLGSIILGATSIVGVASTGEGWRQIVGAGVFRVRNGFVDSTWIKNRKQMSRLRFYKDSADATVMVEEMTLTNEPLNLTLRINGKTDASTTGDLATQYLLAHLPMMMRPDAKNVFVLGFGSGITGGALLGHPVERVTIAENCRPVLEAAPLFARWNRGVLTNERVRIRNEDARAVLKLSPDKYDVIISEPSNPWVVGIGSVFSQEFYELCASRLTEKGIMAQWFHKYEMSDEIVFLVLRTFAAVFPHMEIWDSQEGDLILLGAKTPWESNPAVYQKAFEQARPREDLGDIAIKSAVALWARQVASQRTAFAIPGDGPRQTDEFPILEYAAPQAFFIGKDAHKLYLFDERTFQFTLADRIKIATLRALPEQVLLDGFNYYRSSNPDMRLFFDALVHKADGRLQRMDPSRQIVFRQPDTYPENPSTPTDASLEYVNLLRLEAKLLRDDAKWKESATAIEAIISQVQPKDSKKIDFSTTYFAALVTRFAIGHGDYATALRMLRLGFNFNPDDEQLLFLSRVVDRIVPPEMLREAQQRDRKP
jgi:spermidine synthase